MGSNHEKNWRSKISWHTPFNLQNELRKTFKQTLTTVFWIAANVQKWQLSFLTPLPKWITHYEQVKTILWIVSCTWHCFLNSRQIIHHIHLAMYCILYPWKLIKCNQQVIVSRFYRVFLKYMYFNALLALPTKEGGNKGVKSQKRAIKFS